MPTSRFVLAAVLSVLAVLLLLASLCATPALAEDEGPEGPEAPASEDDDVVVELTITEPAPLQDFLTLARKELGLPLVWDRNSRGIQNKEFSPNLRFRGTREDALHAVRSLLLPYELVLVPLGQGQNRKFFVADMRGSHLILRLRPEFIELDDDNLAHYERMQGHYVTTVLPVQHLENLQAARNALNWMVTGQNLGHVQDVPAANGFVVTDFAPKVVSVYRALRKMDVPPADRGESDPGKEIIFRALGLKHAEAEETARVLQQHFGIAPPPTAPSDGSGRTRTPPAPAREASDLRIDADRRLNQLLVTGMQKDVEQVAEVVASMDRPVPRASLQILVVPLAHVDARRAAAVLTTMIQRGPATWLSDEGATDLPVVVADGQSNTLLIHAGEGAAQALRRLIHELDQPAPGK